MLTTRKSAIENLNYPKSDNEIIANRQWIDRVRGAPAKRRMWKNRIPHPSAELLNAILDPHPPRWIIGSKPRKKKRGRKTKKL